MSRRLKGVLHYDGSAYRGWQRQPDAATIQESCERALTDVLGTAVAVVAAGRTDTGVHARGQVVHFDHHRRIEPEPLRRAWNARLPDDIWIENLEPALDSFHARHDAVSRTYRYFVATGRRAHSPFVRRYSWPVRRPLKWEPIEEATRTLVGTHDFRCFAKGISGVRPTPGDRNPGECTVYATRWMPTPHGKVLEITADRFVRHMVRSLVGVLLAIGRGALAPSDLISRLAPDGAPSPGRYAPPQGLFLWKVRY